MATKWGIVSAGKISNDFVAAVRASNNGEHEFIAVASRNLETAKDFAKKHHILKAYDSYEALAKDQDIEVVYIGSINSEHFSLGKLMLENGKHVLLEKPMTINLRQTQSLCDLAKEKRLFLMEALWSRCLPSYSFLMELIENGTIGEVLHVDANLGISMMDRDRIIQNRLGGGSILDLGIYPLNIVSMIYKGEKPLGIAAVGHLIEGVDVSVTCSLKYSNNRTATITTSGIVELPCDATIVGATGCIKIPNHMYVAKEIQTNDKTYRFALPEPVYPNNYPNSTGLKYEAYEVRNCLKKGLLESPLVPHKDSLLLAKIMDEIRHQTGVVYPGE